MHRKSDSRGFGVIPVTGQRVEEGKMPGRCLVTKVQRRISRNERSAMPDDTKR